ncbi:MAG: hypothetical protein KDD45_12680 [Bdellovibrionales bacterium]|nr:hypothetical protein [Bdellovibrionales bacterium]
MVGVGTNLSQLTFCAMINYLSQKIVSKYTIGTAVSGVLISGIRIVITAIYGVDDQSYLPIIIYFIVAGFINTANIVLNIKFCRSTVYRQNIDYYLLHRDNQKEKNSFFMSTSSNRV